MSIPISLRPPSTSAKPEAAKDFQPPEASFLHGTWRVTHSSLPMWKSKRNVRITYTPIDSTDQVDDFIQFQPLKADKLRNIHGIDTPSSNAPATYDWRGRGWLKIASSHWEILGYGTHGDEDWCVTYFAKTLFTPAGIDIMKRDRASLSEGLVGGIKEAMTRVEDEKFKEITGKMFEIKHDDA